MSFKIMKVFSCKEMPQEVKEDLFDSLMVSDVDAMEYEVYGDTTTGAYLKEQGACEEELVILTDLAEC